MATGDVHPQVVPPGKEEPWTCPGIGTAASAFPDPLICVSPLYTDPEMPRVKSGLSKLIQYMSQKFGSEKVQFKAALCIAALMGFLCRNTLCELP